MELADISITDIRPIDSEVDCEWVVVVGLDNKWRYWLAQWQGVEKHLPGHCTFLLNPLRTTTNSLEKHRQTLTSPIQNSYGLVVFSGLNINTIRVYRF